jgi:hypothetical protein
MGSHPTLDDPELAAEALELDSNDWQHHHAVAHLAVEHPQVRAWPEGNPDLAHEVDHRDWNYDHAHPVTERAAEQAFDRLNPEFGVPADRSDRIGHRDVQQREAALALGVRVFRPAGGACPGRADAAGGRPGLGGSGWRRSSGAWPW